MTPEAAAAAAYAECAQLATAYRDEASRRYRAATLTADKVGLKGEHLAANAIAEAIRSRCPSAEDAAQPAAVAAALPALVAFCSPAMGSGKSTLAARLTHFRGFELVKFAGPLKAMTTVLLTACGMSPGVVARHVDGDLKEVSLGDLGAFKPQYAYQMFEAMGGLPDEVEMTEGGAIETLWRWGMTTLVPGVTSRKLQQSLGTSWGRDVVHPDLWRLLARDRVNYARGRGVPVVIDDMRFPNELDLVRELGGRPVRIVRPGTAVPEKHPSEGQLDRVEMDELVNSGTVAELIEQAECLLALA